MSQIQQPPAPWMGLVLRAAGAYNLSWAAFAIIAPGASLRVAGFPDDAVVWPIWKGTALLIGLLGVGYWFSARNPFQHWLAILMGFLGKVLAPLGLLGAMLLGDVPWIAARMVVPNDLIWWIPLGTILWRAAIWHDSQTAVAVSGSAMQTLAGTTGQTLAQLSNSQRVLVVFLRHSGCTFCREALADLQQVRSQIEAAGTRIALVHMTTDDDFRPFAEKYDLADLPRFADPQRQLYQEFELAPGSPSQILGWKVWWRGFRAAILGGHGFGGVRESMFQMPGTFLIENGKILRSYPYKSAADRPDYQEMSCPIG